MRLAHVQLTHDNCQQTHCNICCLFICAVCGAVEGELLPECPGRILSAVEHAANYQHYMLATGPWDGKRYVPRLIDVTKGGDECRTWEAT